jgi:CDP-diacylglycerol--glycerol-3-phosphate 3-phosphatidyltransferase
LRFPLLFVYVSILYFGSTTAVFFCIPLVILIFLMDSADGYVARLRGEVSLLGSVLDIATDRALEIVLWIVYSDLRLIPVLIPIIAVVRGTTVDAVRTVGMSKGVAAFAQVQNPISRFLVSSRFMRNVYGVVKALAFVLLNIALGLEMQNSSLASNFHTLALTISWIAISMTILRGLPVLAEAYSLFSNNE